MLWSGWMSFFSKIQRATAVVWVWVFFIANTPGIAYGSDQPPQIDDPAIMVGTENELQFIGCNPVYFEPINSDFEQRVVELTNDHRATEGRPPLKRVVALDHAARFHARDMMEDDYFHHDSYDRQGSTLVKVCNWDKRIEGFYPNHTDLGENIAAGYTTPETVFQGWLNSPDHRENIVRVNYSEIGVGFYQGGGKYNRYWVQDFGQRGGVFPVVINLEYAQTSNPEVDLYIYGQGTWDEMRLKNDNGTWSNWQPFQSEIKWTLNWTQGTRTVTVEMRKLGQTTGAISSDTIDLTTSGNELFVEPNEMVYLYNQAAAQLVPEYVNLTLSNLNSQTALTWQLDRSHDWIILSPTIGSTLINQTQITIDPAMFAGVGSFQATVTVTVTEPTTVEGSPKVVPVRLIVVEDMPFSIFLPSVNR